MKRVEIKLNIDAVAPLLDVIRETAEDLRHHLAIKTVIPEEDREFLAGQNSDVRELLGLFGSDFFTDGVIAIDSNNCESLLRGCSALRIRILHRWLQSLPPDLLEDEESEVPVAAVPEKLRLPVAAFMFLNQIQKILLEHLHPDGEVAESSDPEI